MRGPLGRTSISTHQIPKIIFRFHKLIMGLRNGVGLQVVSGRSKALERTEPVLVRTGGSIMIIRLAKVKVQGRFVLTKIVE